ncbi:hypothetical protein ACFQ8W_01715 [Streptomyces sp. NPDC056508]|uniref:hypothetical protein n=1 Tax=Streptomyces sp. NPDC056508 TaxID=3345845 RepID=UPI0036A15320
MDTQTTQPATPNTTTQGTHMYVLTLNLPARAAVTVDGTVTPDPGATRHDLYRDIKARTIKTHPDMAYGVVTFFSLQPNTL